MRIRVVFKNTRNKHIAYIRFLIGLIIQYASITYYKELIIEEIELLLLDFEIWKEIVYKRNYNTTVLVIYVVLSK